MPFRPLSVVAHPDLQPKLDGLAELAGENKQPASAIWKAVRTAIARIKNDGQWGEVIPKPALPRRYVEAFGITNLYCVDLPSFHRLFYTIRDRDVILLDLVDHRGYDRLMKG